IGDFIFTIPSDSRSNRFKLKHFHETRDFEVLTHENFDKDLLNISKKYSTEEIIYLPIEESTTFNFLKFITDNKELNFKYLLPSLSNFQLSRHKEQLNLFCEEKSISCPKHISESVLKNKNFKFPIIKKPSLGSGAKGIVYLENEEQLDNCTIDFETYFVQERLPNPKDIQAGFYLCQQGEIISFYSHKRIRTYPEIGGVTVYSKSECNQEIKTLGAQVVKELDWSGFVMIEFLFDERDGLYKLIEINPRLWGSIMLSEFCNANFLTSYVNGCLNKAVKAQKIDTTRYIRWVFPYDIIYWMKHYSNPFKFFKIQPNTCYINFSYSSRWRSLKFIFFSYFDLKKIKTIFKR
ncbi:MAG: ATP-grasp domain-containing protein, partial [Crocinitomicaceae bacterium]|nr:ATP-grasp domain-containing protein [Crocinitomicaceae bacterium]